MKIQFLYLISLLLYVSKGFSQDIIVKTDSSKIEAKILEVRATEIKYKIFSFQDGPLYVVSKNDIAYVVYANGIKEIFETPKITNNVSATPYISKDTIFTNATPPKGSENAHQAKVGDYIKFNLELGGVINDSYTNVTTHVAPDEWNNGGTIIHEKYSPSTKAHNYYSLNFGCNAIIGKNKIIRLLFGANYLQSKGEYNYYKYTYQQVQVLYYRYKETSMNYKSIIHFINLNAGLRFKIIKNLFISPSVSFNIPVYQYKIKTGFEKTKNEFNVKDSVIFKDFKTNENPTKTIISFVPKISYEFKIKNKMFGIYVSRNFGFYKHLPWWMFGITYYPFRKTN